ncbi:MAG: hypothetical protein HPZ91_11530 [Lentisphaeria bacterium]|nr:hypothetical protein [Lentisphaeria bacterium]
MKFTVGFQLCRERGFLDAVLANRERISEVYFPWGELPNGRGRTALSAELQPYEAQRQLADALREISRAGIALNLLLNGNCCGELSQSRFLFRSIGDAVEHIAGEFGLASVTTASPLIAKFLKVNFPQLEVRASVNMEIGTVRGMDYLAEWFDGYYMKREHNRDLAKIRELRGWCLRSGRKLYCLANSGCLNDCSAHNFHDNLVAHEAGIARMDNAYEFRGVCRDYLRSSGKREHFLCDTNFIRPEELPLYEPYFDAVKLATRSNRNPVAVLEAYLSGRFSGNVTELLEPNHAEAFYPYAVENSRLPADFNAHLLTCAKNCAECGYCSDALRNALVKLPTMENVI